MRKDFLWLWVSEVSIHGWMASLDGTLGKLETVEERSQETAHQREEEER